MSKATTLIELFEANRNVARQITYVEREDETRQVSFAELYERARGILYHLQRIGARRGDKLILFLANNEQFLEGHQALLVLPFEIADVAPRTAVAFDEFW